jgi:hypothetical protein
MTTLFLKTVLIVFFLKLFFLFCTNLRFLYLYEEKVCISSLADVLVCKNLGLQIANWQSATFADYLLDRTKNISFKNDTGLT